MIEDREAVLELILGAEDLFTRFPIVDCKAGVIDSFLLLSIGGGDLRALIEGLVFF